MKHDQVDFAVRREIKHATMRVGINNAGQTVFPLVTTFDQRAVGAFWHSIKEGVDLKMQVRRSAYFNLSIVMSVWGMFSFRRPNTSVEQIKSEFSSHLV
jgi:2-hydroxychromene-2-carboxylate isomerase